MRDGVTVAHVPLEDRILVRIQVPQPIRLTSFAHGYSQKNIKTNRPERVKRVEGYNASMTYTVYILRTSSNTLYIGQTNNLEKRLLEHRNKTSRSAKYIRYFDYFKLVYSEKYNTRIEAMRREYQLKNWTKAKKEALIAGEYGSVGILSEAD